MAKTELAPSRQERAGTLQEVLIKGDMTPLSEDQRVKYYAAVCESVGLNPLTKPFEYLFLKGKGGEPDKLVLYANKNCAEQLRNKKEVSVKVVSREMIHGMFLVTASASMPDGRVDESIGVVPIEKEDGVWKDKRGGGRYFEGNGKMLPLRGDALANAMMKAETKAKRRVTLSICGLGMADESELESILGATPVGSPAIEGPGEGGGPYDEPKKLANNSPFISRDQWHQLSAVLNKIGTAGSTLCAYIGVDRGSQIRKEDFAGILELASKPADKWGHKDDDASELDRAATGSLGSPPPSPRLATAQQVEQLEREFARTGWSGDKLRDLLANHKATTPAELTEEKAAWLIGEFANVATAAARTVDDSDIPF